MKPSPDVGGPAADRAAAADAVVDVAALQAGLPLRARPDGALARAVAARGPASGADRRSGSRCSAPACSSISRGSRWSRRWRWRSAPPAPGSCDHQHARAAPLPRQGDDRARGARRAPAGDHRRPIAHQERPEYLDRLSMLRNQVFVLDHMYMSLFTTLAWLLRLGVTLALLAWVHPALLLAGAVRRAVGGRRRSGGRTSRARPTSAARRTSGWRCTCSTWRPPRRRARRCG